MLSSGTCTQINEKQHTSGSSIEDWGVTAKGEKGARRESRQEKRGKCNPQTEDWLQSIQIKYFCTTGSPNMWHFPKWNLYQSSVELSKHPRSPQTSPTPAVSLTLEIWLASIAEEIESKKMGFSDSRFPPYCIALIKEAVAKQTYEHW